MINIVNSVVLTSFQKFVTFLPSLFGGIIIFLIGLVLASLLKKILLSIFTFFKLSMILQKLKLMNKNEVRVWEEVLAELLRWSVVVLFLIPALEVWGLSRATAVLNQFLFYLPNVIIAVIIGFVGLVVSNLVSDVVLRTVTTIGAGSAKTLALSAKWVIVFFTILIVLNQLGIAQDLIRILFTGIVAMLALAGGLAFGLGGRDAARNVIEKTKEKFKSTDI